MTQHDLKNLEDPQQVALVAAQCTEHMQKTEAFLKANMICVSKCCPELSDRMRSTLISWLIEVHLKYQLQPETLFITVNIVDRYCQTKEVKRSDYQLLGVTAMLIAAKYEEIYVPQIKDFVDITDNTYKKKDILKQEFLILKELDYEITFPTIYRFLERYHSLWQGTQEVFILASYLCELSLLDVKMNKWYPSRIACSALYLSKKMLKLPQPWSREMQNTT